MFANKWVRAGPNMFHRPCLAAAEGGRVELNFRQMFVNWLIRKKIIYFADLMYIF